MVSRGYNLVTANVELDRVRANIIEYDSPV